MGLLALKPNAAEAVERLHALYERRAPDRIFASFDFPSPRALAAFAATHPEGECAYPDPAERAAFWEQALAERPRVDDDSLPAAYLNEMDQGLYGGVLGGDVRFNVNPQTGWISSMVPRLLRDWSELDRLRFTTDHPWFHAYLKQLDVFARAAHGRFGVHPFVLINGLNFVFELVGATDAYLALFDCPERVREAMELGFRVNAAVQDSFFERVPLFAGGTFDFACHWLPGRAVMESVDPFHMTSVACFEEWGRQAVERIFARYDGGEVHLHGNGRHLLEAVSSLRGLKAVMLGDDKGYPLSFDILPELRARAGDAPLVVGVNFAAFAEKLNRHELTGGVLDRLLNRSSPRPTGSDRRSPRRSRLAGSRRCGLRPGWIRRSA
jgi:hypothetical protein